MHDTLPGRLQAFRHAGMARPVRPRIADYASPAAVLADGRLTRSERLRMLDDWVQAIVDREIEARENGTTVEPAAAAAGDRLLGEITEAVRAIEASAPLPSNLVARAWQVLHRRKPG